MKADHPHCRSRVRAAAFAILAVMSSATWSVDQQPAEQLPLKDLRLFAEVFHQIRASYVEEVDDRTLLENAIKGMLAGLDPHSTYLDKKSFTDLRVSTSGEFGGLGIEVGMEDGFVKVISPIDDTPAQRAGIEAGDLIIKLDSKPVKGMTLGEAVKIMRGKLGSKIELTIVREGVNQPFDVTIIRDIIRVVSVRSKTLEEGFGYIRIAQFQVNTGKDVGKAIETLQQKNTPLKGLILDLRNNPGGVLQASVEVADLFLNDGIVVYTEGRLPQSQSKFHASTVTQGNEIPLVVLINGGSASASEIVAGALQDHKRAIIMGTDSFGKGSVQTVLPLNDDRAIKLTTALYYTPNGRSIQALGIKPDIIVERAKITKIDARKGLREADLSRHLNNANGKKDQKKPKDSTKDEGLGIPDNQIYEALNLLKGIHILSLKPHTAMQPAKQQSQQQL